MHFGSRLVAALYFALGLLASGCGTEGGASASDATAQTLGGTDASSTQSPTDSVSDTGSSDSFGSSSSNQTMDTGTTDAGACKDPQDPEPRWECNYWSDDCPEGEKCFLDPGTTGQPPSCIDLEPNPRLLGEPCDEALSPAQDECDRGLVCVSGICRAHCTCNELTPSCPTECHLCSLVNGSDLQLCSDPCHPLLQDCPPMRVCAPYAVDNVMRFVCAVQLGQQNLLEPCEDPAQCVLGSTCVAATVLPGCTSDSCCSPYCELGSAGPCADRMGPDASCVPLSIASLPECPGVDVGVCGVL